MAANTNNFSDALAAWKGPQNGSVERFTDADVTCRYQPERATKDTGHAGHRTRTEPEGLARVQEGLGGQN